MRALFRSALRTWAPQVRCDPATRGAPAPPAWRLTVRRRPALARTRVALAGAADDEALAALELEVSRARDRGDAVTLDLGELKSCPAALAHSYAAARRGPPPPRQEPRRS